jgi:hypothetical protein
MDQYREDQVVVLQYNQRGVRKQEGLTISDRPDTMGEALGTLYQVLDTFPPGPRRDSVQRALIARVPLEQLPARRVFVDRDTSRTAVLSLADLRGIPLGHSLGSLDRAPSAWSIGRMATPSSRRGHGDRILDKKGGRAWRTHTVTHW